MLVDRGESRLFPSSLCFLFVFFFSPYTNLLVALSTSDDLLEYSSAFSPPPSVCVCESFLLRTIVSLVPRAGPALVGRVSTMVIVDIPTGGWQVYIPKGTNYKQIVPELLIFILNLQIYLSIKTVLVPGIPIVVIRTPYTE